MNIIAKFSCWSIQDFPEQEYKTITLVPVTSGCDENKSFSKYTPSGQLTMNISYETQAVDFFEPGKEYYLTFNKAE